MQKLLLFLARYDKILGARLIIIIYFNYYIVAKKSERQKQQHVKRKQKDPIADGSYGSGNDNFHYHDSDPVGKRRNLLRFIAVNKRRDGIGRSRNRKSI